MIMIAHIYEIPIEQENTIVSWKRIVFITLWRPAIILTNADLLLVEHPGNTTVRKLQSNHAYFSRISNWTYRVQNEGHLVPDSMCQVNKQFIPLKMHK